MSDGGSFAAILVSQLGTPRGHTAAVELLGVGILILTYAALEHGIARLLLRTARTIISKLARRDDPS